MASEEILEDELAQAERRMREMNKLLLQSEVIEITGVVQPGGVGAGEEDDGSWTFQLCLQAWKKTDGELSDKTLILHKQTAEEHVDDLMDQFEDYDTVRLRVRYSEEAQNEVFQDREYALLEEILPYIKDTELEEKAKELQEAVVKYDPFYGELILNRTVNWYEAGQEWDKQDIRVNLSLDECEDEDSLIQESKALWKQEKKLNKRILELVTKELLATRNDSWREDDEKPLSAKEFKNRLELESITIHSGGRFRFCYNDNNMFWGHSVMVSGSLKNGPDHVELYG